jgi:hypothetical protein
LKKKTRSPSLSLFTQKTRKIKKKKPIKSTWNSDLLF